MMLGDVLSFQDKLTVCVGAGVPIPVMVSVVVDNWALLAMEKEAFTGPAT